ncbi:DNA-directed RNA polymerase I polypeptide, partial [Aureobasidium melanogenum]
MSLVGALLFCNDCGGLLERCPASQANIDCDVCGKRNKNKWPTSITTESAATAFPSRLRDARSEIQVLSAEDRETWAMTTTACPQCANPEMRFRDVQLRGADEGSTIFYRCPKCDCKFNTNN